MPFYQNIKFRLIGLGLLLIAIGVAARHLVFLPAVQERVQEVVAGAHVSIATYVAHDIDHSIRMRRDLIRELADTLPPSLLAQPEDLAQWLGTRERLNPLFDRGILVLRPDGRLLARSPLADGAAPGARLDADWFDAVLQPEQAVIGKPRRDDAGGAPLLTGAAAVRGADKRVLAVLAGVVSLEAPGFLDDLQQTRLGASGGFLLVSPADGLFITASDPALALQPTPPPGADPLLDHAMAGYRGTGITSRSDGADALFSIAAVPSTGWLVVASAPAVEVFQPVEELRRLLWRNTFATVAGMLILLSLLLPRMLRPLTDAARSIREMADGGRELAPLPIPRHDEVGALVLGFNKLVAKLHEKEQALLQTMAKLDRLAGTDALTGASNRRQFYEAVEHELERFRRYRRPLALVMLDVDLFKTVNDRYGHATGDLVLQQIAHCIRATLRKPDSLTRWGGEEFLVLLPDTGLASAAALAERMRASIAAHHIDSVGCVTASFGVAELGESESRDEWVARADAALYRAKQGGRNRVEADHTVRPAAGAQTGPVQLNWDASFESGNGILDAEHRDLFDEVNRLLSALFSEARDAEIQPAIDSLLEKLKRHFHDEEQFLQAAGYPELGAHAVLHRALIQRAEALVDGFRSHRTEERALFTFLAHDVVAEHIVHEDRKYFPHLAASAGIHG
ncbi:diguanylate cyclase [Thauera aromatica]|uniref:diguanylate cyclase n=1 Tax=Thauera aromatica K172 TaxID=44139 RepID=A0A2R4BJT5_THAAR|nr:diguanylate cyclase [Thauera aromatica]AVR87492.1 diguanylate cyclase [Thauera aromatica K172]